MAHQFRLFIGYSDPEAKEVGRVYQACNFMFLGHDYGTTVLYCDPERPDEWFTDRHVRHRTAYQKYAAEAGIPWKDEWVEGHRLVWERIPPGFAAILKRKEEEYKSRCIERTAAPKGKYAYDLTEDHLLVTGAPRRRSRWTVSPTSWARSSGCERPDLVTAPRPAGDGAHA